MTNFQGTKNKRGFMEKRIVVVTRVALREFQGLVCAHTPATGVGVEAAEAGNC